ncbi:ABC transporter permease [Oleiagrimonas soli]|uniref:ABC transporter ATP-binding protein n=1 Tax=Oleiagrimonas soli TaxID=1543381 RepID=A0A099D017_9GAMM|nr:ABC transporter permease [Oleiagrimonas soli]KGI78595.1 ABC transporter ATP-binding protein [Oleiagrimonas soli]MBB6184116.1 putative ABC transport system permease protein [Oleiagrimonas soli]
MLGYYMDLALRSLRRHKMLAALMVLAIALGIGASITMLTVLHNLSGDPLPQRSGVLFHPQVDPRPKDLPGADAEPPDDLTWVDAQNLFHLPGSYPRVLMDGNWLPARAMRGDSLLAMQSDRATTADFFSMFDVPFVYGSGWTAQDDAQHARVVVLSSALNDKLFGGADSVGKQMVIATKTFRVIGVIGPWHPQPRFYDINNDDGPYGKAADMYLPFFTWIDLPQDYGYGSMRCWGNDANAGQHNPKAPQCTWAQLWVQLDSPAQVASYRSALRQYSLQQHELGRFERAPNVRLRGLLDWLDYKRVIPVMVRMQTWIAFGVFLICMLNTIGLMVAKFLRKSGEIGVRRALGASRRDVFAQCLVEAGVIGVAGGLCGLPLAWLGLWMVRQQPVSFAASAHLDLSMLGAALALSLVAALLAGVWPSLRAARVTPALQVKSL